VVQDGHGAYVDNEVACDELFAYGVGLSAASGDESWSEGGFEIQPAAAVNNPAPGVVWYSGSAKLVRFYSGTTKPKAVPGADFDLVFEITFTPGA
jgi:hypothetical protein